MDDIRVSVIIACSRPAVLGRCLEAFNSLETGVSFELIVVGDVAGVEFSRRRYPLALVPCEERHANVRRNMGLDRARGWIIAFLDDDAFPRPGWLEEAASLDPNGDVVLTGPESPYCNSDQARTIYAVNSSVAVAGTKSHVNMDPEPVAWYQVPFCNFVLPRKLVDEAGYPAEDIPWDMDDFEFCRRLMGKARFFNSPKLAIVHDRYPDSLWKHLRYRFKLRLRTGEKVVSHPEIYARIAPVLVVSMLPFVLAYTLLLDLGKGWYLFAALGGLYLLGLAAQVPRAVRTVGKARILSYLFLVVAQHALTIVGVAVGLARGAVRYGLGPLVRFNYGLMKTTPLAALGYSSLVLLLIAGSLGHYASERLHPMVGILTHELFQGLMIAIGILLMFTSRQAWMNERDSVRYLRVLVTGVLGLSLFSVLSHHPGDHHIFEHLGDLFHLAEHPTFPLDVLSMALTLSVFFLTYKKIICSTIAVRLSGLSLCLSAIVVMLVEH